MPKKQSDSSSASTDRKRAKAAKATRAVAATSAGAVDSAANFIQFGAGQGGRGAENTLVIADKPGKKVREEEVAANASDTRNTSARALRVPDSVQERFIQIGNKFHFPDGTEAFTHQGNRLTTRSENAIVIQSMVAIARDHSAGPVTVGGTEFFRKEAWFAAGLAGLEVRGYEPTEFERERLARAIGARRGTPQLDTNPAPSSKLGGKSTGSTERATEVRSADSELIVGRLVDHGPAPYTHDSKQPMSYFVRIETEHGDRDIWGVDLERAFRHSLSTPGIGEEIGLRAIGKDAVTVLTPERDAQGQEIGLKPLDTHRNQWIVERKSFLDERRKMSDVLRDPEISASDAVKRHPELEGSYLQLQMGRALADKQYGSKAQREQFVEHLRAHLARRIEFGQPLDPVLLRSGEERTTEPRSPDRDYHPTR